MTELGRHPALLKRYAIRNMMFIIIFFLGMWIAFISYKSSNDLLSPGIIFVLIWYIPLSLSFLDLSGLQEPNSSPYSTMIVLGITIIMSVIFLIATLAGSTRSIKFSSSKIVETAKNIRWDRPLILFILSIYMVIVTYLIFIVEFKQIGFPLIKIDQSVIQRLGGGFHRFGKDSKLQLLLSTDYIIGGISLIGFIFSKRYRWIYAFWALTPLITGVLKLSKSDIFEPLVTYTIIIYYIARGKEKSNPWIFKRIAFVTVLAVITFGSLVTIRLSRTNSVTPTYSRLIDFQPNIGNKTLNEAFAFYYGYSSLNFENFSRALINSKPAYKLGLSFFRPVYTVTLQGDKIDKALSYIKPGYLSTSATVGTFMRDLYFEGGIIMVLMGAIAYSCFISFAYLLTRFKPSIYSLIFYAGIGFPFMWLFFQNAFANLNIYLSPIVGISMLYIFSRISRQKYLSLNSSEISIH